MLLKRKKLRELVSVAEKYKLLNTEIDSFYIYNVEKFNLIKSWKKLEKGVDTFWLLL